MQKREISKENEEPKEKIMSKRDLPRDRDIIGVMGSCSELQRKFIQFMAISGRRSADLMRMKWNLIKIKKKEVSVVLPKDKTHRNSLVSFTFNLDEYDLAIGKEEFTSWLTRSVRRKSGKVFKEEQLRKHQIIFKCRRAFRLHSLRNRKAITLLTAGKTPEEVKSRIGWASLQSLLRYTKVSVEFIKKFKNYTQVVNFLLRMREENLNN